MGCDVGPEFGVDVERACQNRVSEQHGQVAAEEREQDCGAGGNREPAVGPETDGSLPAQADETQTQGHHRCGYDDRSQDRCGPWERYQEQDVPGQKRRGPVQERFEPHVVEDVPGTEYEEEPGEPLEPVLS